MKKAIYFCNITAILLAVVSVSGSHASTSYYVDASRVSNGTGTEASPWKGLDNISWTVVANSISAGPVTIYLSSRDTWPNIGDITIPVSGTASNPLTISGDEKYNLVDSGNPNWQTETDVNSRALTTSNGSGWAFPNNSKFISLQGICISNSSWGGINIGVANPTTGIHNITVTNCHIISPINNHGIWFGFAEAGCHSIKISHNVVSNTQLEGIYIGHYNYFGAGKEVTNVVVEYNTVVDTGLAGEGDIDIKPCVTGAIVRYNKHFRTKSSGSSCGVVCGADKCQIYGNEFYRSRKRVSADIDWGYGIYLNADGDGIGNGKEITSCLIYNNLIYSNDWTGIKILATTSTAGADISGVKIWNNTILGNGVNAIYISATGSRRTTIADMRNNIFGNSADYDVVLNGSVTISACDYNLYYRTTGSSWSVADSVRSWAQWKALGFDAHGINANPNLDQVFQVNPGSPVINSGADLSSNFATDKNGAIRTQWDMGAYRFLAQNTSNIPPAVSAIVQNVIDIDPVATGLQVLENTTVQYTCSATDVNGDPLVWQWLYAVNGGPDIVYSTGNSGVVAPISFNYPTGSAGSTYLWKVRVSDSFSATESLLSTLVVALPLDPSNLKFEAENGSLTSPMLAEGGYIVQAVQTGLTDSGRATYPFVLDVAGSYVIEAIVDAPSLAENSFFIGIDSEPQDPVAIWHVNPITSGFETRFVSWQGNGPWNNPQFVPKVFSLSAGAHQLIIRGREPNGRLDRISLMKLPSAPLNLQVISGS